MASVETSHGALSRQKQILDSPRTSRVVVAVAVLYNGLEKDVIDSANVKLPASLYTALSLVI